MNTGVIASGVLGPETCGVMTAFSIQDLGFASHHEYLKAFADKVAHYVKAGYMLNQDAIEMRNRAALCPH